VISPLRDKKILVVLQNSYAKGGLKNGWNPSVWWKEFKSSRSGIRLRKMFIEEDIHQFHYCNAAPGIGDGPDSLLEPSARNLRRQLRRVQPHYVIACGKLAEWLCQTVWLGNLVVIPHLAYRPLTNELLRHARALMVHKAMIDKNSEWSELHPIAGADHAEQSLLRVALRQRRGSFEIQCLQEMA